MIPPETADPIPYATPSVASRSRIAPAVWIALIGLALIGLGGCFCIGIMEILMPHSFSGPLSPPAMTPGLIEFLAVLHAAAFGCFGGAVFLIQKGVRLLLVLTK